MGETIGQRITRMRKAKDWSRPQLGREMARAIARAEPFTGELIRLYEEDINRPSVEARGALAKVFGRSESYIEFGPAPGAPSTAAQPRAEYEAQAKRGGVGDQLLHLVRIFLETDEEGRIELLRLAQGVVHGQRNTAGGSSTEGRRRGKRR